MSATDVAAPAETGKPRHYGFSVLVTGFARVWRAPLVMWVMILLNALVQALLVLGDPVTTFSLSFLLLALASFLFLLVSAALMTAAALETVTGRVGLAQARARSQRHFGLFTAWFVALLLALLVGASLYTWPGLIIALVTPFVLLAAMDGHANALAANFRALGSRWGRWLITAVIMAVIVFVSWLLGAVSAFFITGSASAFIVWVWFGFLFAWFQCSWAALFRSTDVGRLPVASAG